MNLSYIGEIITWKVETGSEWPLCSKCKVLFSDISDLNNNVLCENCYGQVVPDCQFCHKYKAQFKMPDERFACVPCYNRISELSEVFNAK